ncbi:MAG: hypothetical protein WCR08_09495 [Gammaproteobacteria bacterium]
MHHKKCVHDNKDVHLKLLELIKSNQSYKSTTQNLLEQHKKLISLTKELVQVLEAENPSPEKQTSIIRQLRLFGKAPQY